MGGKAREGSLLKPSKCKAWRNHSYFLSSSLKRAASVFPLHFSPTHKTKLAPLNKEQAKVMTAR